MTESFPNTFPDVYLSLRSAVVMSPSTVLYALCLLVLTHCVTSYVKARAAWKTIPTLVFPISPFSILTHLLPCTKWTPGHQLTWMARHKLYVEAGSEVVSISGVLWGQPRLWVSSPEIFRQILANKTPFSKPSQALDTIGFLGANVVASNGEQWKTHRKIAAPAFTQESYRKVWAETMRTYHEICSIEGWNGQDTVAIPNVYRITQKLALFIISSCGFNIPLTWGDGDYDDDGRMSLQAVLSNVASGIIPRWLTPKWLYYLPNEHLQRIDTAYKRIVAFLLSQIEVRKKEIQEELDMDADQLEVKRDLFSRLVATSVNEGGQGLTDQEIIGNTFVLIFAGHETTAHTLVVTLVLLGLYEEEQKRVHAEIVGVLGDRVPAFADYDALEPIILPVAYEAMRLYPPAYALLRQADEDTSFSCPRMDGSGTTELHVPKGTEIILDIIGACYNRRLYPDTDSFNPSRWNDRLDSSPVFSYGPRICLGRKFATTEMVCFLSLILRDWEIHVPRGNVTREQWREQFMRPTLKIAMSMASLSIKLTRRRT